jgi:hypothetical protein
LLSPGSVSEDYLGFVANIGSSNEYPLLNLENIQLRPGNINLVGISAIDIQASTDIKSISAERRNCYFSEEYQLDLHQNYSQANCLLECQMNFAIDNTSWVDSVTNNLHYCTPWFLPKNDSTEINICDPWEAIAFTEAMQAVPEENCDHCLPDCAYTDYDTAVTILPFRPCNIQNLGVSFLCNLNTKNGVDPPIFAAQLANEYGSNVPSYAQVDTNIRTFINNSKGAVFKKLVGVPYNAYDVDIAMVTFYFESSTVMQFSRDNSFTWIDFMGQIGGFLGLCDGFSLCSAVEIVFWFTCRLWYNVAKAKKTKTEPQGEWVK